MTAAKTATEQYVPTIPTGAGLLEPALPDDPRWLLLREPFPDNELERKPQPVGKAKQGETRNMRGKCEEGRRDPDNWPISADDYFCGGYHTRSVHLTYVGHAGLTMRLNNVCGPMGWDWEPVATDEHGFPLFAHGGLWIRLTIMGHTKLGFGDAGENKNLNGNAVKEMIGDAMRNAALRFGVATYLWGKSDKALLMREYAPPSAEQEAMFAEREARERAQAEQREQERAEARARGQQQRQQRPPQADGAQMADTPARPAEQHPLDAAKARHRDAINRVHPDWDGDRKGAEVAKAFADARTDTNGQPVTVKTASVEDWDWLTQGWLDELEAAEPPDDADSAEDADAAVQS